MEWMIITHDDSNSDDLLDDDANSHKDSHDVPYSRRILIKPVEVQVGGRSVVSSPHLLNVNDHRHNRRNIDHDYDN